MRALPLVPAEMLGVAVEPLSTEYRVEDHQLAQVPLPLGGQPGGYPAHRPAGEPGAQLLHPVTVVGHRLGRVVERVVDQQPPGVAFQRVEGVVAQVLVVAHVAVDHLDPPPAAAPDQVGVVEVLLGRRDLQFLPQQLLHDRLAVAGVVEVAGGVEDTVDVHTDQFQAYPQIVAFAHLDLAELAGPLQQLAADQAHLPAGDGAGDAAVVEGGQLAGGEVAQRRHRRRQRGQQQGLHQPVVAGECPHPPGQVTGQVPAAPGALQVLLGELVAFEQVGAQLGLVQLLRGLELDLQLLGERLVAAAGDHVVEVAERDELPQPQLVAAVHQQLSHQLQGGTRALQGTGDVHQGGDERRAERIRLAERLLIGTGAGVGAEQRVPHLLAHLGGGVEGAGDRGRRLLTDRGEQPPAGDLGQVAVLQCDQVEPAAGEVQGVLEAQLTGAGHVLADQLPQVPLAGDEADHRDRAARVGTLHEVGDLLDLAGEELRVADRVGQPQDQLVQEQDQPVVTELLGVPADLGEPAVEGDEALRVLQCVAEEALLPAAEQVTDELATQLVLGTGGERRVQPRPGPERLVAPLVVLPTGQAFDEPVVADPLPQIAALLQQRVGAVHGRDRRFGVQLADVLDVAAEYPLLQRLGAEQVVGHQQELPSAQPLVVFVQQAGELVAAPGRRLAAQQRVQHGHEVRLSGAEGAV